MTTPSASHNPPGAEVADKIVIVIDDDQSMRETLGRLFRSVGMQVRLFSSASELLATRLPDTAACIVLDVRLPGPSGFELQTELAKQNVRVPIVFITGHGDIPMSVRAMKAGAIDFLIKPFREQDLLDAVNQALELDSKRRIEDEEIATLRSLYDALTPRQREVMLLVTNGLMNKQIAGHLGLSEITVKIHRGDVMKKMKAKSLADLVRMAEALRIKERHST